jgi:hypothetical protein
MTLRRSIGVFSIIVALVGVSANQAKAVPPPPVFSPPPATSITAAAGFWAAGTIIGLAAALCIYDVWLKINGLKNWDGTPIVQKPPPHHHR